LVALLALLALVALAALAADLIPTPIRDPVATFAV
jgi:hypothetical protein